MGRERMTAPLWRLASARGAEETGATSEQTAGLQPGLLYSCLREIRHCNSARSCSVISRERSSGTKWRLNAPTAAK